MEIWRQPYLHRVILRSENEGAKFSTFKRKCLFLDRDGVVIKERNYISEPLQVELEKGAIELMQRATEEGYIVVIVTNQSGIERRYFGWGNYEAVTWRMLELIDNDKLIAGIYANGYKDNNYYRKPQPGMIKWAAINLSIDNSKSIIIGDKYSDVMAGYEAGVSKLCHILTGHGRDEIFKYKLCNKNSRDSGQRWMSLKDQDINVRIFNDLIEAKLAHGLF